MVDGDTVTLSINGITFSGAVTSGTFAITVSGADLATDLDATINASVTTTDAADNSTTATATDSYSVDVTAPNAPTIVITEDTNNDGLINTTELNGDVDVVVTLPIGTVAGDTLVVTDAATTQTFVLTASEISAGEVATSFAAGADGAAITVTASVTDIAGNTGASANDNATRDTSIAAGVTLAADVTADDVINATEAGGTVAVSGTVSGDVADGDTVVLTVNGKLFTGSVVAGAFTIDVNGSDLVADVDSVIEAAVTTSDTAGNEATATDTEGYSIDITAPSAPSVVIVEDTNNDGFINASELSGDVDVSVNLPIGASSGDELSVSDGTTTKTFILSAAQITAGTVSTNFVSPDDGNTINVSAFVTDVAGNVGASATDSALIDTTPPAAAISLDANITADDVVNVAEAGANVIVSGSVGGNVQDGDTVTLLIDGTSYTGLVASGAFAISVGGNELAADADSVIDASVTTIDAAGNATSASDTESYSVDTSAPTISIDVVAGDDIINAAEDDSAVVISGTTSGAEIGRTVTIGLNGNTYTTTVQAGGSWNVSLSAADAQLLPSSATIRADVSDAAGNIATQATRVITHADAPTSRPSVTITEDANDDGFINAAERNGNVNVRVGLPVEAVAGDVLTLTDGTTSQSFTLTSIQVSAGEVLTTFAPPTEGGSITVTAFVTNIAGNVSATATDTATIDTVASATITLDANITADDIINTAEAAGAVTISGTVGGDAKDGDAVTLTIGGNVYTGSVNSGRFDITVTGNDLRGDADSTIDASLTAIDTAGNIVTATDIETYSVDIDAPAAPVVTTTEDADDDGFINANELVGPVNVSVILPAGLGVGDVLSVTDGSTTNSFTLTATQIATGTIATSFASPGQGNTITVTASVTDTAGNQGTSASDAALVDTTPPAATISIDADITPDDVINTAESQTDQTITGVVGGDVQVGDTVTLGIGSAVFTGTVFNDSGTLRFAITVAGGQLAVDADSSIDASVVTSDLAGNTATAVDTETYSVDTTAPTISIDVISGDDIINVTEDDSPVTIFGSTSGAEVGQAVTVGVNGFTYTTTVQTGGDWSVDVPASDAQGLAPSEVVTADVSDSAGNSAIQATRAITHDAAAPSAPTVVISEDANNDGFINSTELTGNVDVTVTLPFGAVAGDTLTVTDGISAQTFTLTPADVSAGEVLTSFTAPVDGATITVAAFVTDVAGNVGASANDNATRDTSISAGIAIATDITADDVINAAEAGGNIAISGTVSGDVADGDTVSLAVNGNLFTGTVVGGEFSIDVDGSDLVADADLILNATVTASDLAGNSISATDDEGYAVDIVAPSVAVVQIVEDADNDGFINSAELVGTVDVRVTLPADATEGDTLTVTDGTTISSFLLSAADIAIGSVLTDFVSPGEGAAINVAARVTDAAGNTGPSATDAALVDTTPPTATITIDGPITADDVINAAEAGSNIDITGTVGGDVVDGDTITLSLNSNTYSGTVTGGAFAISVSGSDLAADSVIEATVMTSDNVGNTSTATDTEDYSVDTTPPTISIDAITGDDRLSTGEASSTVTISGGTSGAEPGQTVTIKLNGNTYSIVVGSDGTWAVNVPAGDVAVMDPRETLTAEVSDAAGNLAAQVSRTFTIDQPPVAVGSISTQSNIDGQIVVLDVSGEFSDPNGYGQLIFGDGGTLPPGLSIDPVTGLISGTVDSHASVNGPYSVEITVTNSVTGLTALQTFTWNASNLDPIAANDARFVVDGNIVTGNVLTGTGGVDVDPDGDGLTVAQVNGSSANVATVVNGSAGGVFTIQSDGSYSFDPRDDFASLTVGQNATTIVSYTISDGDGGTDTANLIVTILGANDSPVTSGTITAPPATDGAVLLSLETFSFFDDIDAGDTLTFDDGGTLPPGLTIDTTTGDISGTLPADASLDGPYSVTITATDSHGAMATQTFLWTITNPAPSAFNDFATTGADAAISLNVTTDNGHGADSDPDGDALKVRSVNGDKTLVGQSVPGDTGGTFIINPDGSANFDPTGDFDDLKFGQSRTTSVVYAITDDQGGVSTATLTISVTGLNTAPVGIAIPNQTSTEDQTISGLDVSDYFSDPENEGLTFNDNGTLPAGLTIDGGTGIVSGTPEKGTTESGPFNVTITVEDPHGLQASRSFTWTITGAYAFDSLRDLSDEDKHGDRDEPAARAYLGLGQMPREVLLSKNIERLAPEPILAGYASPGSVLVGRIYDANGSIVGESNVIAGPSGNWTMHFFGARSGNNSRVVIEHIATEDVALGSTALKLTDETYRTLQLDINSKPSPTAGTVLSNTAYRTLGAQSAQNINPLGLL